MKSRRWSRINRHFFLRSPSESIVNYRWSRKVSCVWPGNCTCGSRTVSIKAMGCFPLAVKRGLRDGDVNAGRAVQRQVVPRLLREREIALDLHVKDPISQIPADHFSIELPHSTDVVVVRFAEWQLPTCRRDRAPIHAGGFLGGEAPLQAA